MNIYHFEYTTKTHEMTARVLAHSLSEATEIIEQQEDFEAVTSVHETKNPEPMVICFSGWRKGF